MKKYCFGVDVGGTTIKLGLFTVEGELLEKWEIPTRTENQSEAVLPDVAAAVLGKKSESWRYAAKKWRNCHEENQHCSAML